MTDAGIDTTALRSSGSNPGDLLAQLPATRLCKYAKRQTIGAKVFDAKFDAKSGAKLRGIVMIKSVMVGLVGSVILGWKGRRWG